LNANCFADQSTLGTRGRIWTDEGDLAGSYHRREYEAALLAVGLRTSANGLAPMNCVFSI
jgi:hypothetical protein